MTHPLTDELLYEMFLENSGMGFTDDNMRAAYDKGAADRLEQVIEWIYANLVDDNEYYSNADLYSDGELRSYIVIDNIIDDLIQAMRPQEDN